ncbi:hypothetical protein PVL29_004353 [Vitis rotundifolia]|uniref:Uncharacterized protein n=1 Tax=Vitis rotundifolia TaxID=103349 RepID=A0AA39A8C1_VITRO|nr:hypothetical protein PVL29_004353 [Vitis rotundifolia]
MAVSLPRQSPTTASSSLSIEVPENQSQPFSCVVTSTADPKKSLLDLPFFIAASRTESSPIMESPVSHGVDTPVVSLGMMKMERRGLRVGFQWKERMMKEKKVLWVGRSRTSTNVGRRS